MNEYICTFIKNPLIHLTQDIRPLIKLSFATPKSTMGLDALSVMPTPPSRTTNPPPSSPYDTIHEDLALYKIMNRSDPMEQFFATMKNLKSPLGTSFAMSGLA
jgi:hypothetical protein